MIRAALNTSAPFFVGAGICGSPILAQAGINGITESEIGKTLLIIMAFAVIVNQLWQVGEKAVRAFKGQPQDLTGMADSKLCEHRHAEIVKDLTALQHEDNRKDRINKEQYQTVAAALVEMRHEMRTEFDKIEAKFESRIVGLHKRSDAVLQAVSRLEGKVNP